MLFKDIISSIIMPKSESQRRKIVNEIKINIINNQLENDPASKILWSILDRYVEKGDPVETTLYLQNRYDMERKYVVKLYNSKRRDMVLIRIMNQEEIKRKYDNISRKTIKQSDVVGVC
jgi:hypothetical protein